MNKNKWQLNAVIEMQTVMGKCMKMLKREKCAATDRVKRTIGWQMEEVWSIINEKC